MIITEVTSETPLTTRGGSSLAIGEKVTGFLMPHYPRTDHQTCDIKWIVGEVEENEDPNDLQGEYFRELPNGLEVPLLYEDGSEKYAGTSIDNPNFQQNAIARLAEAPYNVINTFSII
jgi:hypothetical protein